MADELKTYEIRNVEGLWEDKQVKGRGSFGAVYEVKANGVPCIAKRLHDILQGFGRFEAVSIQDKTALQANFRRECVILSKLRHPNIVQFLGVYYGRREGDLALLMEYLHTDLDQCLTDNPDVPLPIKISILLDVSYGLFYLHTQNPEIIHRDLKAENVLLTTDMRAKLADLGVAKIINLRTCKQSHTIAPGTNAVMPPEALQASPHYNYKLDVFSFGALTVHVVTQEFPNVHEVPFESMQRGRVQIAKRMSVIQKMSQGHCLYPIAIECLVDDQNERPTTRSLNERLKKLSDQHSRQFQDFLQMHREIHKQQEMLNEDAVRVKKLEKEMAESKTWSLHEIQLLTVELEGKQGEVTQLMKQMEQRETEERLNVHWEFQVRRLEQQLLEMNEQLQTVTSERDELKQNQERLNAHWESQVRRLEQQLQKSGADERPTGDNGTGYMQSNPSYNINTGGGTSKYSNYSTGTYQDRSGGRYGSTGSRQQYGDVGGHQTTENFGYYKRYQDSAGYDSRTSQVSDPQMHTSSNAMPETYDNSYFRQLSKEGFSPANSKVGASSPAVSQLQQEKQDMAVDYERQLLEMKEQLQTVTSERDELKQIQERLNAHWESQVRRLEQQLQKSGAGERPTGEYYDNGMTRAQLESAQETITQLESQLNTLKRQRSRESQMGREAQTARDLEKELNEVKDRNAALQSQLTEYAGVISDQSKVIQSGKVQDSEYVQLQQHHIHLGEYLKKQQLEYEEALSSLKKKISSISKLGDENLKIHQLNVNLTAELEDYRTQTKRLLADLRQRDSELAQRDAEIGQLREQRGYYSSSSSDVGSSGEFNVGQLQQEKQDMAVDYEQQLLKMNEQLQTVTSERDELKQNQERLNAHWESQVRRLEQQLQKSGAGERPTGEYYDNVMTSKAQDYETRMHHYKNATGDDQYHEEMVPRSERSRRGDKRHLMWRSYRSISASSASTGDYSSQQPMYNRESSMSPPYEDQTASSTPEQYSIGDYSSQQPMYNRESSMSPPYEDQTASPTPEQYSPHKYTTGDDQYREDVVPKSERNRRGDSRHPWSAHRSISASSGSSGGENRKQKSRSRSSGGLQLTDVRTKNGKVTISIQKPLMPLNPKEKPQVIIKRGEGDFEMGTLMYIGVINQKEMAGIQLDIRMPRPQNTGSYSTYSYTDGTCELDGIRHFKCPNGFGVYVPISKVYIEANFDSVAV